MRIGQPRAVKIQIIDPDSFIVFDLDTGIVERIPAPEPMLGKTPVVVDGSGGFRRSLGDLQGCQPYRAGQ